MFNPDDGYDTEGSADTGNDWDDGAAQEQGNSGTDSGDTGNDNTGVGGEDD